MIGWYLKETNTTGIYIRPRYSDVKLWVDADFSGNFFPEEDKDDSYTERSP